MGKTNAAGSKRSWLPQSMFSRKLVPVVWSALGAYLRGTWTRSVFRHPRDKEGRYRVNIDRTFELDRSTMPIATWRPTER